MRNPIRLTALVLAAVAAQGCSSSSDTIARSSSALKGPPTCEGLAPEDCLLPWPSSRFLVRDKTTRTGWRVALPAAGMPKNVMDSAIDPGPWNRWDGFSPMTSAIVQLPVRIDPSPLVDYRHVERSLEDASPTILIDATAGKRVAHWAEVEAAADVDPNRTTLYVRPAARLEENHRYVVVIRRLKALDGSSFEGKHDLDDEIGEAIDHVGIERKSIALAWDFRTASGESAWGDLVAMRNDAVSAAGSAGLGCAVTNVTEDPNDANVLRRVDGTITVPFYLDGSGLIARDSNGVPQRTGTTDIAFTVAIPRSAAKSSARFVMFEHGLLTDRTEMLRDFMVQQANDQNLVFAATDLTGLAAGDEQTVGMSLFDLNAFSLVMDRIAQSVVGTLLLPRTIAGACSSLPAFQIDGRPAFDGSHRYYYGISQGGNLAPTFAALSDDMERFVMSVGGISYPVMITRSVHWPDLEQILAAGYPSRIQRDLLMVMFAHHWERIEGSAFAPHVRGDTFAGGPKHVLAQIGLYDVQTPNEGSYLAARTMHLPQASYDAAPIFGLKTYATTSSDAMVTFDMGVPAVPPSTVSPSSDNGVHEAVRRDPRAQRQIDAFLQPNGVVIDACNGACR